MLAIDMWAPLNPRDRGCRPEFAPEGTEDGYEFRVRDDTFTVFVNEGAINVRQAPPLSFDLANVQLKLPATGQK